MKNFIIPAAVLFVASVFSGCAAIAGIFKAGTVVGVIGVIVVIAIIIWVISLFRGKS